MRQHSIVLYKWWEYCFLSLMSVEAHPPRVLCVFVTALVNVTASLAEVLHGGYWRFALTWSQVCKERLNVFLLNNLGIHMEKTTCFLGACVKLCILFSCLVQLNFRNAFEQKNISSKHLWILESICLLFHCLQSSSSTLSMHPSCHCILKYTSELIYFEMQCKTK